jgi:hypothetical protein
MSRKMDWLLGSTAITFTVEPVGEGLKLPGFKGGKPLAIACKTGETVQVVMDRFNTYRGPDAQIPTLWRKNGEKLPFSSVLTGNMVAVLKGL